jgi:hypothetical protein
MAASDIELWCDITNGKLVLGLNDNQTPFRFENIFQGSSIPFKVFLVKPVPGAVGRPFFSQVAIDNVLLRMTVGPRAGAESILAYQDTWTKQTALDTEGKSGYFYAALDLNTTALNTAIGSSETYATYLELQISEGSWRPVAQTSMLVTAVVRDVTGASVLPTPADAYYTKAQIEAMFLKKYADDGDRLVLRNGSHSVELACGADGTLTETGS